MDNYKILDNKDYNKWNNHLEKYGLNAFQHRLLFRLMIYIHKIFHNFDSPINLFSQFIFNRELNKKHHLRNLSELCLTSKGKFNDYPKDFFRYFFSKFINLLCIKELELSLSLFKIVTKNNINILFEKFVTNFDKFDLKFKIYFFLTSNNIETNQH